MNTSTAPLRIFVAMPGTDMGAKAIWKSPKEIEQHFLEPIRHKLQEALQRPIELVIEKEKIQPGEIYRSMFREAWEADVYVADLTGANANVYLELGVRWAMRDGITILVCQDVSEIKFNAAACRAIPYGASPAVNDAGIEKVADAIIQNLNHENYCDSPVRQGASVVSISAAELANLRREVELLRTSRGEDLLAAARKTLDASQKTQLLRQAIQVNPTFFPAHYELGITLRKAGDYPSSIESFKAALALKPGEPNTNRELGVAYSKNKQFDFAIPVLEAALTQNPSDFDALSVLGGVYRRVGMNQAPQHYDWVALKKSHDCYARAAGIAPNDTYPLLNVARLELLLSKTEPERKAKAVDSFQLAEPLCHYKAEAALRGFKQASNAKTAEEAYWRVFDHADSLLFAGRASEARKRYQQARELIPQEFRKSVLSSVISPLKDFLHADILELDTKRAVEEVLNDLSNP